MSFVMVLMMEMSLVLTPWLQCQNQGNCHPVTGNCHCPMGWTVSCYILKSSHLQCLVDWPIFAQMHMSQFPLCTFVRLQGAVCANPCPSGTYHLDCRFPLECLVCLHNHREIIPLTGLHLVCLFGGTVWAALRERCDCYNGAHCDHVNGQCHCLPGYKGEKVE